MGSATCRKFTMADAMIVVGAMSVAFAAVRGILGTRVEPPDMWDYVIQIVVLAPTDPVGLFRHVLEEHLVLGVPCLAVLSTAWAAIALRRPRPAWRRLSRQPGAVACVLATLGLLLSVALDLPSVALTDRHGQTWHDVVQDDLLFVSMHVGVAVLWGWVALALAGCWRPVPNWIDRGGRALGILWIGTGLLYWLGLGFL